MRILYTLTNELGARGLSPATSRLCKAVLLRSCKQRGSSTRARVDRNKPQTMNCSLPKRPLATPVDRSETDHEILINQKKNAQAEAGGWWDDVIPPLLRKVSDDMVDSERTTFTTSAITLAISCYYTIRLSTWYMQDPITRISVEVSLLKLLTRTGGRTGRPGSGL
jgi:hypothetical protein